MKRTEEQIVAQSGVKVMFGDREIEIRPLTMRKALAWREDQLPPMLADIFSAPESFENTEALQAAVIKSGKNVADVVLSYLAILEGLTKEEQDQILDSANETAFYIAFGLIMAFAMRPTLSQRQTAKALTEIMNSKEDAPVKVNGLAPEVPSTLH